MRVTEKVTRNIGILRRQLAGKPPSLVESVVEQAALLHRSPVFFPSEIAKITGLSEIDASRFLRTVAYEPFLYVFYDVAGKVVDWDTAESAEVIKAKATYRILARPEFHSYKIFEAKIGLDMVEERWR